MANKTNKYLNLLVRLYTDLMSVNKPKFTLHEKITLKGFVKREASILNEDFDTITIRQEPTKYELELYWKGHYIITEPE